MWATSCSNVRAASACIPGQHVLVRLDGERRLVMTESFAHHLDGYARLDQQRRMGVAKVVQPDERHLGPRRHALKGLRDRVRMHVPAMRVREEVIGRGSADGLPLDPLP